MITETAVPNQAAQAAVGSGKRNINRARPTDGQTVSPSPPANQDSDVQFVESIGGSDGDSDYVNSAENSPMSPANTPYLTGHFSELEEMHEVPEGDVVEIARPPVLFSRINELEIPELDDANTNPPENN